VEKYENKGPADGEINYENKAYPLHCNQNFRSKRVGTGI